MTDEEREAYRNADETVCVGGVWYDRRDTVNALTDLLADARAEVATLRAEVERLKGPVGASAMDAAKQAIARAISPQRWSNLNAGEESRELFLAEELLARAIDRARAKGFAAGAGEGRSMDRRIS